MVQSAAILCLLLAGVMVAEGQYRCSVLCPAVYRPVCASNGVGRTTFTNECQMNRANRCGNSWRRYRLLYRGQCRGLGG